MSSNIAIRLDLISADWNPVDAACHLVTLIWPTSDDAQGFQPPVISLRFFVRETLRRSRTSYSTLQLTLWYLTLIKPFVTQARCQLQYDESIPYDGSEARSEERDAAGNPRSLCCGRRMFLTALILSSKFLQDRNFTARAWSKITGLPNNDIVSNETKFLAMIKWDLYLSENDFLQWNSIIIQCTESTQLGRSMRDTWTSVLSWLDSGSSLHQTAQALLVKHGLSSSAHDVQPSTRDSFTATSPAVDITKSLHQPAFPSTTSFIVRSDDSIALSSMSSETRELPPAPGMGGNLETPSISGSFVDCDGSPAVRTITRPFEQQLPGSPEASQSPELPVRAGGTLYGSIKATRSDGWREVTNRFPMDQLSSPESIDYTLATMPNGGDGLTVAPQERAIRNRAFGMLTPSPSAGSIPSDDDVPTDDDGQSLNPSQREVWDSLSQAQSQSTAKSSPEDLGSYEVHVESKQHPTLPHVEARSPASGFHVIVDGPPSRNQYGASVATDAQHIPLRLKPSITCSAEASPKLDTKEFESLLGQKYADHCTGRTSAKQDHKASSRCMSTKKRAADFLQCSSPTGFEHSRKVRRSDTNVVADFGVLRDTTNRQSCH